MTDKNECEGCQSALRAYIGIMRNANAWIIRPDEIGVVCLRCAKLWKIAGEQVGKWQVI